MNLGQAIVVPKLSKFDWDLKTLKLTREALIAKYEREGVNVELILHSHEAQQSNLDKLKRLFRADQFVALEKFKAEQAAKASLVISLGGDNHLQNISHYLETTPLLGVNSDPERSEGKLTYFVAAEFEKVLERLSKDEFNLELWTRLEAKVNGSTLPLITSDCFLGERERAYMSRHIITHAERSEEQKCSGLLIVTGVGSTGWYDSSCRYLYPHGNSFGQAVRSARYLVTEPYRGKLSGYSLLDGALEPEQELVVHSLNDSDGVLTVDSYESTRFNRGDTARIKISERPLRVVSKF